MGPVKTAVRRLIKYAGARLWEQVQWPDVEAIYERSGMFGIVGFLQQSCDPDLTKQVLRRFGANIHPDAWPMLHRVRATHTWLRTQGRQVDWQTACFDQALFGQPLAPRQIDARIAQVLQGMRDDPAQLTTAQDCAARVGLSFSRFLHLFKAE